MHGFKKIVRPVAYVVAAAHIALALQPLSAIAQEKGQTAYNPIAQNQLQRLQSWDAKVKAANYQTQKNEQGAAARLNDLIKRASEQTRDLLTQQNLASTLKSKSAATAIYNPKTTPASLQDTLLAIQDENGAAREDMRSTRQELVQKGVSAEILRRHDDAAAQLEQKVQKFDALTARLVGSVDSTASLTAKSVAAISSADLQDLGALLGEGAPQKKIKVGKDLPWRNPTPTKREPAQTRQEWVQQLDSVHTQRSTQAAAQTEKVTKVTTAGGVQFIVPPAADEAPTDTDLAETDEVVLTDAVKAKALELGKNPVAIQNWVRNHIEWVPTWGAVQNADSVLASGRGNAFDIASLTIALLRANRIPARYQLGTIELPASSVMNWVGGVQVPAAAQQLLAQGGIANKGMVTNGVIGAIRMEHVWVSAYVNYAASKGAVDGGADATPPQHPNTNAYANGWLPLDASFKQYQYAKGMDLQKAVPLDAQALLTSAQQGATVNEAEGWVQNLNQAAVQSQMQQYQTKLQNYINSQNASATVGDVIGKKIIPEKLPQTLSGQLPYSVVTETPAIGQIPGNLQHQFSYTLSDQYDDPVLSYTEKVSHLAGKRITLSYVPADQATQDLIASYLPKPHADGTPIQPSELPTSLPGYLIRLKPQISVDGQVVAQSQSIMTMGTDLQGQGGFTQYSSPTQWDLTPDASHVVGQATAIGISAGGITVKQMDALKARLEAAQKQQAANSEPTLTGEQVSGDILISIIWTWFAMAENNNHLNKNQSDIVENPGLSYGLFHSVVNPIYSWGVIRKVNFPAVNIDVGHMRFLSWSKNNERNKWIDYNRARGQYISALEHATPERFFNDRSRCNLVGKENPLENLPNCPQGISAVKAIGLAANQGQKIFTITKAVYAHNSNIVNTALISHSYETRSKVQQALDAGMEVTIHEKPIIESGWKGAGFMRLDPDTGTGGYTIEGGSNGGWYSLISEAGGALLVILSLISLLAKAGLVAALPFAPFIMLAVAVIVVVAVYMAGDDWDPKGCGGISTCDSLDAIQIFAVMGAIAALFAAGSLIGLVLGLFLFYQFMKGKYFY